MRRIFFILLLSICFCRLGFCEDPAYYQEQARNNIAAANKLYEQAARLLRERPTQDNMQTAVSLFIEAGKMFEQASIIFQRLAPDYASQEDVVNSQKAVERCVQSVEEVRKRMTRHP